jgi:hypothetical protein
MFGIFELEPLSSLTCMRRSLEENAYYSLLPSCNNLFAVDQILQGCFVVCYFQNLGSIWFVTVLWHTQVKKV